MEIDSLLELLKKRRSIRRFKPDPIPDEYIGKILEAGRWAMSGANAQPWELIVVKEQETKIKIANAWFKARREQYAIEQTRIPELRHHQLVNPPTQPGFKDAPVLIVVCGDRRTYQATVLAANFILGEGAAAATYIKNMANVIQNMHLAIAALGLGSQWLTLNKICEEDIRIVLDVPSVLEIDTIVALGYPAYTPGTAYRRELKEFVHYGKYDRSKFRSGEQIVDYIRELRNKTKSAYGMEKITKPK